MRKRNLHASKIGLAGALFGLLALLVLTAPAEAAQATSLFVDAAAPPNGDGSLGHKFVRITDARAIRRESAVQIVIHVEPGVYVGSYTSTGPGIEPLPIRLDVPGLKLFGTTAMERDELGLPTGVIKPGSNTLLLADPPLESIIQSLLVVGSASDEIVIDRVTVANLSLNAGSGNRGRILRVDRVQDYTLLDNYITGGKTDASMGIYVSRSSGDFHGLALRSGGTALAWGSNGSGQLGNGSIFAAAFPVHTFGLSGTGVIALGSRAQFTLALRSDGTVLAWGGNTNGQLGDGSSINRITPVQVVCRAGDVPGSAFCSNAGYLQGVLAISSGNSNFALAVLSAARCWRGETTATVFWVTARSFRKRRR